MATRNHSTTSKAISETSPSRGDPVQLYQLLNLPGSLPGGGGGGVPALGRAPPMVGPTVVTAAMAGAPTAGEGTAAPGPATEGRAGKAAARRRPRAASRKTPTTVLSIDAVNFRAMVQQFTGAHPAPFEAGGGGGGQVALSFGLGGGVPQLHRQPAVFPFGAQQQQQLHQNEERPLFAPGGSGHRSAAAGGDAFLQGYVGQPQRGYVDVSEGFLPESVSPSQNQMMPKAAASRGRRSTDGSLF